MQTLIAFLILFMIYYKIYSLHTLLYGCLYPLSNRMIIEQDTCNGEAGKALGSNAPLSCPGRQGCNQFILFCL